MPAARVLPELDRATLDGCRAGDGAALGVFVRRHQAMVFAFLSRTLGAGSHVEDLAQEVFLRACRALPGFDAAGTARLSTWLLTIASRVATDARRKRKLSFAPFEAGQLLVAPGTPETERRRAEIGLALARAASELSDAQRDVFVLAEFHDLDTRAIAAVLRIRESTARTRLFRARERLRELLRGVWEDR
ncbi:MAG TPA: sigma-70 family RNA polymerase sigma factor [Polyangiaceae bacterium]|nr:sigma-70 family RNA polymerase sigma factor [Polyangiaceae bacterium]